MRNVKVKGRNLFMNIYRYLYMYELSQEEDMPLTLIQTPLFISTFFINFRIQLVPLPYFSF